MINVSDKLLTLMSQCGSESWFEILGQDNLTQDFITQLEKLNTVKQVEQVRLAIENGLSYEQISVFAKPEFSGKKMAQMRTGFEYGLSCEQVAVYAKPELSVLQMKHLKLALVAGQNIDYVKQYAKANIHYTVIIKLHNKKLPYDILVKEHFV
ncbi:MAG: hypothetical protein IJ272_09895 [Clostridia bacterium]|nr:hypothetical protein [Clostridia bacterium]